MKAILLAALMLSAMGIITGCSSGADSISVRGNQAIVCERCGTALETGRTSCGMCPALFEKSAKTPASTPEDALMKFLQCMRDFDMEGLSVAIAGYDWNGALGDDLRKTLNGFSEQERAEFAKQVQERIDSLRILTVKKIGAQAIMEVEYSGGVPEKVVAIKEGGVWKIALSSSADDKSE